MLKTIFAALAALFLAEAAHAAVDVNRASRARSGQGNRRSRRAS
jgi:hypothetical protein